MIESIRLLNTVNSKQFSIKFSWSGSILEYSIRLTNVEPFHLLRAYNHLPPLSAIFSSHRFLPSSINIRGYIILIDRPWTIIPWQRERSKKKNGAAARSKGSATITS